MNAELPPLVRDALILLLDEAQLCAQREANEHIELDSWRPPAQRTRYGELRMAQAKRLRALQEAIVKLYQPCKCFTWAWTPEMPRQGMHHPYCEYAFED